MTKIKLEIETDSEKELVSATVNFKYSNGKLEVSEVKTNQDDNNTVKSKSNKRKSSSKSVSNDIYEDLKNLPSPEEGVDESFMEKY